MLNHNKLFDELSKAMNTNPDMYIGDLMTYVVEKYNPARNKNNEDFIYKTSNTYPISNSLLYDALVKYNKTRFV